MGRKLCLLVLAAALPAGIALGQAVFYDNEADFVAAAKAGGFVPSYCDSVTDGEDFEEAEGGGPGGCPSPLVTGVPHPCFPNGMTYPPPHMAPSTFSVVGTPEFVVLGPGFLGPHQTIIGPNRFVDTTDLEIPAENLLEGIAMLVVTGMGNGPTTITAFDAGGNQIGQGNVNALNKPTFAGFLSAVPIDKVNVSGDQDAGELLEEFCYYDWHPTTTCHYTVKRSKQKKGCTDPCPAKGSERDSGVRCDTPADCPKKFKEKLPCAVGFCKVVSKKPICKF